MGGPVIPWRPGRVDADNGKKCPPDGRLPDASQGAKHVDDVFSRMGFNDEVNCYSIALNSGRGCICGDCEEIRSNMERLKSIL